MSVQEVILVSSIDGLPEYPINKSERLESHFYMEWHFNRWLSSEFCLLADPDVGFYGLNLFSLAQNETPVGTLPSDERLLCKLLRIDLEAWRKLMQREITPLFN